MAQEEESMAESAIQRIRSSLATTTIRQDICLFFEMRCADESAIGAYTQVVHRAALQDQLLPVNIIIQYLYLRELHTFRNDHTTVTVPHPVRPAELSTVWLG
jgi:hypothetical protein